VAIKESCWFVDYDAENEVAYVWVRSSWQVARTLELSDAVLIDVDCHGLIVGVELLNGITRRGLKTVMELMEIESSD
jgi:uncharacterized protein YuzE